MERHLEMAGQFEARFARVYYCMALSKVYSERSAKPLFIGSIPIAASNQLK